MRSQSTPLVVWDGDISKVELVLPNSYRILQLGEAFVLTNSTFVNEDTLPTDSKGLMIANSIEDQKGTKVLPVYLGDTIKLTGEGLLVA